jgi:hypothetical protein
MPGRIRGPEESEPLTDMDLYADTPESRAAWERAVLEAVREDLDRPGARKHMLTPSGRVLREVRLEGSYPNTLLVVGYTDVRSDEDGEMNFELWRPDGLFVHADGDRDPPEFARNMIYAHVIEP